jgi:hypothetical protein
MSLVYCDSFPKRILFAAACALVSAGIQVRPALAQHGGHAGGHPVAGGHLPGGGRIVAPRAVVPPSSRAPISQSPAGFQARPIFIRHHVLIRAPFFRFRGGYRPLWWLNCGAAWAWDFGCGTWRVPEYGVEYYVPPPPLIYEYPAYLYYGGGHELVWLYLKDGTAYGVSDYWFVNDQLHFIALQEGGVKSEEKVIGLDELDVQKTIDVNTRRGFRVVMRDEPLEQYLRDHPDANPPMLEAPQKN